MMNRYTERKPRIPPMEFIGPQDLLPPEDRDAKGWPLLTLLVGPIDSGKTTFLHRWHETWQWGDGFLSAKQYVDSRLIGYDLVRLSTGESSPWARIAGEEPAGWKTWIEVGPFRMCRKGFSFAAGIVDSVIAARNGPMILDEAGLLELSGAGFAPLLEKLLAGNHRTLVAIRDFCLLKFLSRFPAAEPRIVQLGKISR